MPRLKGTGKGPADRFNIRLDEATAGFYRTKANEHGISISEYLRQMLVQGVIAENVHEIELRLRRVVDEIRVNEQAGRQQQIPDDLLLSVFTSESMLASIVEARDVQKLYEAQDKAKARLKRLKGSGSGQT